jgi:hypothetical protein
MATRRGKKQNPVSILTPFFCKPLLAWKDDFNRAEFTTKLTLKEIDRRSRGVSEEHTTITSPDCTVRTLIPRATDTARLVMNYRGWQAGVYVFCILDVGSFGV